jgi:tetratricopeptide (TPR) repeat protein
MFFPKLRRRAKWVFLLLAIAFGGGFLIFGVGAGGSGIGDYIADLLNRPVTGEGPSLEDAREAVQENPDDPEARLDLARAAQREGQVAEAIAAFERYRTMNPTDSDALRTLAALYSQEIAAAQERAAIASGRAQEVALPRTLAPQDSPFLQEVAGNALTDSVSAELEEEATAADSEVRRLATLQLLVYEDLTGIVDDDPLIFFQYATAAETAQDYLTAITAYRQFLDLAPNNPNAEQIEERIEALQTIAGIDTGTGDEGAEGGAGGTTTGPEEESDGGGSG